MSNTESKYIELIERIKNTPVELNDSQNFTSEVMSTIELISPKKNLGKFLSIISWASSIAALLLIGLFLFEQDMQDFNSTRKPVITSNNFSYPLNNKNGNLNNKNIFEQLNHTIQLKKERQKAREAFCLRIINKIN